nr:hypothetical protein GCM10025699_76440 [Microbacterium flavescens]
MRLLPDPDEARTDPRARQYIVQTVAPGATLTRQLEITNTTGAPREVSLYSAGADISDGSFDIGQTEPNALSSWMRLSSSRLTIPDGASDEVTIQLVVPDDAPGGEQYAVVWAEMRAPASSETSGVSVVNRVGIRSYIDVDGEPASPAAFDIGTISSHATDDGLSLTARVANVGDVAVDLSGDVTLSDGPGSTSAGPFPSSQPVSLAPGQDSTVTFALPVDLAAGPWTATVTLASGDVSRSATTTLTLATSRPAATQTSWTTPVIVAIVVLSLAGVTTVVVIRRRRRLD